ncbi:zinc-dependent alcohol dehydrogenase family protein [Tardiphaga sp. 813_E8_N1_3]|uniref:zinc-dependent alcohol dehydrogenase family protein n=1 Tax=Tardiphaga sp. 813_E8_N1_3 TaxID=3240760 RepID=UPI003F21541B
MTSPNTMKAAILERAGAPLQLTDIPRPRPASGQVLVRIKASAVNPLDLKIAKGEAAHARHPFPAVLGIDTAGIVEELGLGVTQFSIGDEVYGMTGGVGGHQGTLAEFIAADADLLARKPGNLSMREAAALPLVFITAWEGLVDRATIRTGQKLLVHGGAGGVGHMAIQIGRALGADAFATGAAKDEAYIESLGARFIDYSSTSVADYVAAHTADRGFDVIYDTVGGPVLDASFNSVARFGHVVSALGWGTHTLAPLSFRAASYSGVFTLLPLLTGEGRAHHGEILRMATKLTEASKLVPKLDSRHFTFADVNEAHDALRAQAATGKIVIEM